MRFGYCGINYRKANQDIRDKIYFTDSKREKMLGLLEEHGINQSMILSTCNRSEVFYFFEEDNQRGAAADCFKKLFADEMEGYVLESYLEQNYEKNAIEYLFRVASGLESMVLGEDQILGQVREALQFSVTMGYSKKEQNRVVTDAIACAKKVKSSYRISEIPLSIGYVGVKELNLHCPIKDKRVLLIGSGQTAGLALKYLEELKPSLITVCNRTRERAEACIKENLSTDSDIDIEIRDLKERYDLIGESDIVVSATASPHLIIEAEKCRIDREIFMLDLASPRDIDTAFKDNSMCTLINIDMLGVVVENNKRERMKLSKEASSLIEALAEKTEKWLSNTTVDKTIESLQKRCDDIVNDSFEYINRKLTLSEHEQAVIERTLRASLKRLLREPLLELKGLETREEQERLKRTVEKLFHI